MQQSVLQKVLIFDKPKDGWKSGSSETQKDSKEPAKLSGTGQTDLSDLLGALRVQMASVEKDYLKPSARGVCASCRQQVLGDQLVCRGRVYHPDHFSCSGCKTRLGTDNFYFKPGLGTEQNQFCRPCYEQHLTPTCIACEKPITGRHTYWNGTPYHVECFCCSRCDQPIVSEHFAVVNSAPFCLRCEGGGSVGDDRTSAKRKGKCTGCGLQGEDNYCEKCGSVLDFR